MFRALPARVGADDSRRRAARAVTGAALVFTLLATGCGSDSEAPTDEAGVGETDDGPVTPDSTAVVQGPADIEGEPQAGGSLVIGIEAEPDGLDPTRSAFDVSGHLMASAVFDPLVRIDDDGAAVPHLAESVEPSDDFTEWVIMLRDGVTFHDGEALDAEALVLNFQFWKDSFITAPTLAAVESVEATGPLAVTVRMSQPWVTFPYTIAGQTSYVAAPSFLENPVQGGPPMNPVGTGPFRLAASDPYLPGQSFNVVRNEDYWQEGKPYLDSIEFRFLADPLERVGALRDGDVDLIHGYTPSVLDQVRAGAEAGELKVVSNGEGEEDVLALNADQPPFDDPVARQAVSYATNAAAWRAEAEAPADGKDHAVTGPFVEGQLGYSDDDGYLGYDLAKAKELVAQYEAEHGEVLTVELLSTSLVTDQALSEILVEQWAQAGIETTIRTMPLAELVVTTVLGDFQAVNWRNFGAPDPDAEYLWWHSSGVLPSPRISTNVARYADPAIDEALDRARASTDPAERDEAYQVVARKLNEGAAYVWLGRPTWVLAAEPQVQNLAVTRDTLATLGGKTWLADLWVAR